MDQDRSLDHEEFVAALRRLRLPPAQLDRDRLLYAAGQQSMRRWRRPASWLVTASGWLTAAATISLLSTSQSVAPIDAPTGLAGTTLVPPARSVGIVQSDQPPLTIERAEWSVSLVGAKLQSQLAEDLPAEVDLGTAAPTATRYVDLRRLYLSPRPNTFTGPDPQSPGDRS